MVKYKKVKKIKYKKVLFKLSEKQKSIIDRYCIAKRTTPNKMIKTAIKEYIMRNASLPDDEYYISENQLKLFDFEDDFENADEDSIVDNKFENERESQIIEVKEEENNYDKPGELNLRFYQ
jgi:hypothetical protein